MVLCAPEGFIRTAIRGFLVRRVCLSAIPASDAIADCTVLRLCQHASQLSRAGCRGAMAFAFCSRAFATACRIGGWVLGGDHLVQFLDGCTRDGPGIILSRRVPIFPMQSHFPHLKADISPDLKLKGRCPDVVGRKIEYSVPLCLILSHPHFPPCLRTS